MAETISLNKQVYAKGQYERVIDTSFTQLIQPQVTASVGPTISVPEFFQNYQDIFFLIPKFGETNSHEYLIKTSQEYIGNTQLNDATIQALVEEVTSLRQENLELQQQLSPQQLSTGSI
jgi:hypothetical protein